MSKEIYRSANNIVLLMDDDQWTVAKVETTAATKKDGTPNEHAGEEILQDKRFYRNLQSALNHVADIVAKQESDTLKGYIQGVQGASVAICRAIEGVKHG